MKNCKKALVLLLITVISAYASAQTQYYLYRNSSRIFGPASKTQCEQVKEQRMKQDVSEATARAKAIFEQTGSFGPKVENPRYEIVASENSGTSQSGSSISRVKNSTKIGGAPDVSVTRPSRTYTTTTTSTGGRDELIAVAAVTLGVAIISGIISSARKARLDAAKALKDAENERIENNRIVTESAYKNVSSQLVGFGGKQPNKNNSAMSGLGLVSDFEVIDENAPFKPFEYEVEDLLELYYTKYIDCDNLNPMFEDFYSSKTGRDINLILQHIKFDDNDRRALDEYNAFVKSSRDNLVKEISKFKSSVKKDTLDFAVLANDVYDPGAIIGSCSDYKLIEYPDEAGDLKQVASALEDLNKLNDDFFAKMYYDENKDKYVISFRGSTTSFDDWNENANNASGQHSEQFSNAYVVGELLKNLPPELKDKVILTGHSKGGGQASLAGAISGIKTFTFNASGVWIEGEYDNITAYFSKKDPLNEIQDHSKLIAEISSVSILKVSLATAGLSYAAKAKEFGSYFLGADVKDEKRLSEGLMEISKSFANITLNGEVPEAIGKRIEIDNTGDFKSFLPTIVPVNPIIRKSTEEVEKYMKYHSMNRMQNYFEKKYSVDQKKWNSLNYIQLKINEQLTNTDELIKQRRLLDTDLIKR